MKASLTAIALFTLVAACLQAQSVVPLKLRERLLEQAEGAFNPGEKPEEKIAEIITPFQIYVPPPPPEPEKPEEPVVEVEEEQDDGTTKVVTKPAPKRLDDLVVIKAVVALLQPSGSIVRNTSSGRTALLQTRRGALKEGANFQITLREFTYDVEITEVQPRDYTITVGDTSEVIPFVSNSSSDNIRRQSN